MFRASLFSVSKALAGSFAVAVLLLGCSHGLDIKEQRDDLAAHHRTSPMGIGHSPVVVVAEPFFSGAFESYEVYQKTYDVVSALTHSGLATVAPWEYRRLRRGNGALLDTDVGQLLRSENIRPEEALWLELRVVMLGGSSRVGLLGEKESIVGVRSQERGEVRIKLRDIHTMKVVSALVVSFVEDGLSASVNAYDSRPVLTSTLRKSSALVSSMIARHYPVPERCCGVRTTYNPTPMFSFEVNGNPPLSERFEKLDALDSLVAKLRYYQYFDPDLSVDNVMDFESRAAGLLVKTPGPLGAHGLEPGDYILTIGGRPALGPQSLTRHLLSGRQAELNLLLVRGNEALELVIPI